MYGLAETKLLPWVFWVPPPAAEIVATKLGCAELPLAQLPVEVGCWYIGGGTGKNCPATIPKLGCTGGFGGVGIKVGIGVGIGNPG